MSGKTHAYKNGFGAYDDGEAITHNPFHPHEESRQWEEWREGWNDAAAIQRDWCQVEGGAVE